MCQRARPAIPHNPAVVDNFLKLGGGFIALAWPRDTPDLARTPDTGRKYY